MSRADWRLGGPGGNADSYGPGVIGSLKVTGAVTASLAAAGLHPLDPGFTTAASRINMVSAKSCDPARVSSPGASGRPSLAGR